MNTLTLERLEELVGHRRAILLADPSRVPLEYDVLIAYARERAARERCEALLPVGMRGAVFSRSVRSDGQWLVAGWKGPEHKGTDTPCNWVASGDTLTEAYEALAAALEAREA